MDHLLEHEGEAVPAAGDVPSGASSTGGGVPIVVDVEDDEDADAAALGIGAGPGDVEAKVRLSSHRCLFRRSLILCHRHHHARNRASNVRSVTRRSGIPPWRISTPRRAGMISLRKVQTRYVVPVYIVSTRVAFPTTRSRLGVQIKPLTEEEKEAKLAELRAKMAAKRAVKTEQEIKEAKESERIRRKQGKVCRPDLHRFPALTPVFIRTRRTRTSSRKSSRQRRLSRKRSRDDEVPLLLALFTSLTRHAYRQDRRC